MDRAGRGSGLGPEVFRGTGMAWLAAAVRDRSGPELAAIAPDALLLHDHRARTDSKASPAEARQGHGLAMGHRGGPAVRWGGAGPRGVAALDPCRGPDLHTRWVVNMVHGPAGITYSYVRLGGARPEGGSGARGGAP